MQCNVIFVEKKITKNLAKDKNHRKVTDHCHFTGKYRGVAHGIYNLRFKMSTKIPVVFHKG